MKKPIDLNLFNGNQAKNLLMNQNLMPGRQVQQVFLSLMLV